MANFDLVNFANSLLANANRPAECTYPNCGDECPAGETRCDEHCDVRCGGCSQPATRRDAHDCADVCDYCGEDSDRRKAALDRHERRMAEMELT